MRPIVDSALRRPSATSADDVNAAAVAQLREVAVRLGSRTIWSGATLQIRAGTVTAVLGPNGSGKSTLLRLLLGLVPAAGGEVQVLGEPPRRGNNAIGYVPQRRLLDPDFPIGGRELVAAGADGTTWGFWPRRWRTRGQQRDAVQRAISSVGAASYASSAVGRLSGGEQQRLLLAQALVSNPRLVLLDEPLTSLDVHHQAAIADLITKIAHDRGVAVVVVTHDVNPVLQALDQVVYIAQNRVIAGTPAEVITSETLSRLYEATIEVVRDRAGRIFVLGIENQTAHPHEELDSWTDASPRNSLR